MPHITLGLLEYNIEYTALLEKMRSFIKKVNVCITREMVSVIDQEFLGDDVIFDDCGVRDKAMRRKAYLEIVRDKQWVQNHLRYTGLVLSWKKYDDKDYTIKSIPIENIDDYLVPIVCKFLSCFLRDYIESIRKQRETYLIKVRTMNKILESELFKYTDE